MNKNWSKTTLGSLGKISMCKRILKEETSKSGDIPFYKISTFGGIADAFISKDIFEKYRETYSYPKIGDILISAAGTLGKTVIFDGKPSYFQDSNIVWVDNDEKTVINSFLYYFYQTSPWIKTTGSTINRLYNNDIKNLEISFPNLIKQQSIASVLSALDKKIALDKQINARLEEMAKTLYDYWFVQFDFPDANGKPYKSSGGEMVFDETLKRKIPKGWEVKNLGDWAEIRKGTLITEKTANTNGDIKVISAGVDFSYYHDVANRPRNTITISASGANAGFVNFWREPIFACDCTTITNRVIGSTLYILNFLKIVQDFIYQQARGSAQPHVYPKDIEGLKIIVPPDLLLKRFSEFVENWNLKIANNEKQNHHLTQLRDFLLPMLMNGQVSVAE
ncbi:restriction endonuclease subunit S [Neisseria bacilliformis]|uniref:restriction endonuclease subunit S n=1 Tax=Neisseria bacilliformis TaxID=267212 RepID=UPI0009E58191|nr:restriction endonuclease subunit S [Neisseria bacilliformis]